ncbi:hypothetical protein [Piscinibacter sakaiensis]|nr:hypothetical protein [Piscinibacter sakaiensis]
MMISKLCAGRRRVNSSSKLRPARRRLVLTLGLLATLRCGSANSRTFAVDTYDALRKVDVVGVESVRLDAELIAGTFDLDELDHVTRDDGGTVIVDKLARRWKRKYSGAADVRWFGARGDGLSLDTVAIQRADRSIAAEIYFPPAIYPTASVRMTKPWYMADGAWLKYVPEKPNAAWIVKCEANRGGGRIHVDGNWDAPMVGVLVTGNGNTFAELTVRNIVSGVGDPVGAAIKISGRDNNVEKIRGVNILRRGNSNMSSPQLLTFGKGAEGNRVRGLSGIKVTSGVVSAATSRNFVGRIDLDGALDNGIYNTSGYLDVDELIYRGEDEAIVVIGGGLDLNVATIYSGFNAAVGIANCEDVRIANLMLRGAGPTSLCKTRGSDGFCRSLTLSNVSGVLHGDGLCYMARGKVGLFRIDRLELEYRPNLGSDPRKWAYFSACERIELGKIAISIVSQNVPLSHEDVFLLRFPPELISPSSIDSIKIDIVDRGGASGKASWRALNVLSPGMSLNEGFLRTDAGPFLEGSPRDLVAGRLYANGVPKVGVWRAGQRLWDVGLSNGGWRCVEGGSPGVWIPFGR